MDHLGNHGGGMMKRPCRCTHLEDAHPDGGCLFCHCAAFADATTEHTAGLRALALPAMLEAMRVLTKTGQVPPLFLFREADGTLARFEMPEEMANLMNNGQAKDLIFGAVRTIVQEVKIQAVVFVTDAWYGRGTAKAMKMPHKDFLAATRERAFQTAVDDGLVERSEALVVTVQTPARTMIVSQLYERNEATRKITYREVTVMEMPVDEFGGRQKMYGDLREQNLR